MTNTFKILTLALTALILAFGCDKVKFPTSTVETYTPPENDTVIVQKVIIEEFTGQACGGCPGAAVTARSLAQAYPDQAIIITIHAGYFADTSSQGGNYFPTTLATVPGNELADEFDVLVNPIGMVNRKEYQSNLLLSPGTWSPALAELLSEAPQANIDIETDFDASTNELSIVTEYQFLSNLSGDYNLVVLITETDIYDWQKNYAGTGDPQYPAGDVPDYKHEHVYRAAVNGTWGQSIVSGNAEAGSTGSETLTYTLDPNWIPENCSVVAYITNTADRSILQAEEVHVTP